MYVLTNCKRLRESPRDNIDVIKDIVPIADRRKYENRDAE
jgi:hypothetical protein